VCGSVLQCVAVSASVCAWLFRVGTANAASSVLQCVAVYCSVLQCLYLFAGGCLVWRQVRRVACCSAWECVAVYCSMQYLVVCCSVMQRGAVCDLRVAGAVSSVVHCGAGEWSVMDVCCNLLQCASVSCSVI